VKCKEEYSSYKSGLNLFCQENFKFSLCKITMKNELKYNFVVIAMFKNEGQIINE